MYLRPILCSKEIMIYAENYQFYQYNFSNVKSIDSPMQDTIIRYALRER